MTPAAEAPHEPSRPQPAQQVHEAVATHTAPPQPLRQVTPQRRVRSPERAPRAPQIRPTPAPAEPVPAVAPTEMPREEAIALAAPSPSPEPLRSPPAAPTAATSEATTPSPPVETETPVGVDAAYRSNPAPRYPLASRRLGEQGTVILRVEVSEDGNVERLDVGTSSGSERLDRAALATVANWRFEPARRGRMAVASAVEVPIIFRLEN